MPETEPQETIIDQFFHLLEQLVLPNWSDLIALLPWVLVALIVPYLLHTAWQWRKAGAINRPRVAPRLAGGAPPVGIHMPGPSRWPFVVPIGAVLILFGLAPARDERNIVTAPVHIGVLALGLLVTVVAVAGWLWDAMREWRATAAAEQGVASHSSAVALAPQAAPAEFVAVEPPPGVHMPGPSPWPFFAPIAMVLMLYGLIFSVVMLLGGLILAVIALGGWLRDAGREYRSTEAVGHAIPATRDPVKAWPRRVVPIFATVIAISVLITLAPLGLGYLNGLTPPSAGPSAIAVPAKPEISASTAISFDTGTLIVPCCRAFELVFDNKQAGVPHNVEIQDSAKTTTLFDGEVISGVASVTYNVPALPEGDYWFQCKIHPNMNGTLQSRPESGGAPAPGPPQPGPAQPGGSEAPAAP